MDATALITNLTSRGIRLTRDGDGFLVEPASKLTPVDREQLRQHKADLLTLLRASHEQAEAARFARLDAERREADRETGRGYDFDCSAPSHAEYLERACQRCACQTSPFTIVATCRRYGVALRIDADRALVVGRSAANVDEATQPWPSLLIAIEAHLEAVAMLVASGWSLRAEFPESGSA
jgi:tubulysin polyketide synthase-like protein